MLAARHGYNNIITKERGEENHKERRWQQMAEVERTRNEVIYKREITTDEPNAHAELILKVDGLPEEALDILRKKFNALAEMVEREVREKTSLTV
jgi:hypothetical protein